METIFEQLKDLMQGEDSDVENKFFFRRYMDEIAKEAECVFPRFYNNLKQNKHISFGTSR